MNVIAIQDANILIDLIKTGLFPHCMALEYRFMTTQLIIEEILPEQVEVVHPFIVSGRFEIIEYTGEELEEIILWSKEDLKLSEEDWSVLYSATNYAAMIMTGDARLRSKAEERGIAVCGILRILDELLLNCYLTRQESHNVLQRLMQVNSRLPADECKKRLDGWGLMMDK